MNKIDDMRYKAILLLVSILALATSVKAQETYTVNDTIYNPKVVFSGHHPKYEIAGIKVTGADNYEDYIIIGYSGLSIGQRVEIPGEDIKNAAKRFWRQGLFSKVQIKVEKVYGDKAWLEFDLQQQPRISQVNYLGMKGGEKKDVIERLGLTPGNQMTPNIADRVKIIVQKYFVDKGFDKATVEVIQKEDLSKKNEVIVDIVVDKHSKIGVHKIYIDGNEFLDNTEVRTPIAYYLLHRMDEVIDGRRFIFIMDEFWKWLLDDAFRDFAFNKLKTIRKQNGFVIFLTIVFTFKIS